MSDIEAGSETIRMKRGDLIEAMIEEGFSVEAAEHVYARLTQRDRARQLAMLAMLDMERSRLQTEIKHKTP